MNKRVKDVLLHALFCAMVVGIIFFIRAYRIHWVIWGTVLVSRCPASHGLGGNKGTLRATAPTPEHGRTMLVGYGTGACLPQRQAIAVGHRPTYCVTSDARISAVAAKLKCQH
jgi:hypothetical protein